tara:strand:- start:1605 stop:1793 length:189 start_codon:yes stop_codon:yes gene_type:complete
MKKFVVENTKEIKTIKVIIYNPPYENKNILYKTGWKEEDCIIHEMKSEYEVYDIPESKIINE